MSPRLPARRGQTGNGDEFSPEAWDEDTAERADELDEEDAHDALVEAVAATVCSGCDGPQAARALDRPVRVRVCECGGVVYREGGAQMTDQEAEAWLEARDRAMRPECYR